MGDTERPPDRRGDDGKDRKVFVGGLNFDADEAQLRQDFGKYGDIEDIFLPRDRDTQKPRGFGFVTFAGYRDAEDAAAEMNGQEYCGRKITVNIARPRDRDGSSRGPGGGGGGYGGYGGGGGRGRDDRRRSPPRHDDRRRDDRYDDRYDRRRSPPRYDDRPRYEERRGGYDDDRRRDYDDRRGGYDDDRRRGYDDDRRRDDRDDRY